MSISPVSSDTSGVLQRIREGLVEAIRREMATRRRTDETEEAGGSASIELRYSLSNDDVVAFNMYHLSTSPNARNTQRRPAMWVTFFFMFLMVLTFRSGVVQGQTWPRALLHTSPLFVFLLAFLLIWPRFCRWRTRRYITRGWAEGANRGTVGPQCLIATEQRLLSSDNCGDANLEWHAVEKAVVLKGYVFLYTSAFTAIVIPLTAFDSPTQLLQFLQLVGRRAGVAVACPSCGYDLRGSQGGRCPECGYPHAVSRQRDSEKAVVASHGVESGRE